MTYYLFKQTIGHFSLHFKEIDGDIEKVLNVDNSIDIGVNPPSYVHRFRCGRAVSTEFLPKQIRPDSARKKMPDYVHSGRAQLCSQAFKDILEGLEPGVHQFEPVEVVTKKKVHIQDMYWVIPCNRLDTLVLDQINPPVCEQGYFWPGLQRGELKIVFDRKKIGNHHMWTERRKDGSIYVSDAFANAVNDAGLVGLDLTKWQDI